MAMELKGRVVHVLPLNTGVGRNGPWKKQEFVVETQGSYPKQVCFSLWGDKIDQYTFEEGDDVSVFFDLESRSYNNRWYTDARAWQVVKSNAPADDIPPPEEDPSGESSHTEEPDPIF